LRNFPPNTKKRKSFEFTLETTRIGIGLVAKILNFLGHKLSDFGGKKL
jgi:hypothetical protein